MKRTRRHSGAKRREDHAREHRRRSLSDVWAWITVYPVRIELDRAHSLASLGSSYWIYHFEKDRLEREENIRIAPSFGQSMFTGCLFFVVADNTHGYRGEERAVRFQLILFFDAERSAARKKTTKIDRCDVFPELFTPCMLWFESVNHFLNLYPRQDRPDCVFHACRNHGSSLLRTSCRNPWNTFNPSLCQSSSEKNFFYHPTVPWVELTLR